MEDTVRKISDSNEVGPTLKALSEYQSLHNIIRKEFQTLLAITEKSKSENENFTVLCNACLRSLFSLVEADLFGLNQLIPYNNFNERHSFKFKFKKTITNVCMKRDKKGLQKLFFETKYEKLTKLRKKRDLLLHPKESKDIQPLGENDFEKIKEVFSDYCDLIHNLMNGFFIEFDYHTLIVGLNNNIP
jgi:hypothetical protein